MKYKLIKYADGSFSVWALKRFGVRACAWCPTGGKYPPRGSGKNGGAEHVAALPKKTR